MINVLDTGAPDDGSDVLIVNGVDSTTCSGYKPDGTTPCPTDDIFLLRASNYIASTPTSGTRERDRRRPGLRRAPARQLRHGDDRLHALTNTSLTLCYNAAAVRQTRRLDADGAPSARRSTPTNFVVGRRIHLGGGDSGVWAGDYTIASIAADGSSITLAETLPTGVSLTTEQVPTTDVQLLTA